MKLALLSDIHGNLEALTAVLRDIVSQKADKIYCLGDVIGYGSEPSACLDLVNTYCEVKIMGNHEYVILGMESTKGYTHVAKVSSEWTRNQLTDEEIAIISTFRMDYTEGDMYFVHSSPYEPKRWHYILSPEEAAVAFEHLQQRLCFHGHSHIPLIYSEKEGHLPRERAGHSFLPDTESRYLINIGSVGQPRDNDPRACYVIYDTAENEALYRRVEYDIKTTQQKMAKAQLPEMLIDRLAVGR